MTGLRSEKVRQAVRETYGKAARAGDCACDCGCGAGGTLDDLSAGLGYSKEDIAAAPDGANLGLGCGNPQLIASLRPGETVLDLGSGGGFDCFLAARAVGEDGHVIGVDMTPAMVAKARENAAKAGLPNVEFRLGEIEHLPVANGSVDVVISNCVINLSPEKPQVFADALRVLKPGGRIAVTDVVATAPLPEEVREDLALHAGCVAGAAQIGELTAMLQEAGFVDVRVTPLDGSKEIIHKWAPGGKIGDYIVSAAVEAVKP